jgi:hypothetical protein
VREIHLVLPRANLCSGLLYIVYFLVVFMRRVGLNFGEVFEARDNGGGDTSGPPELRAPVAVLNPFGDYSRLATGDD